MYLAMVSIPLAIIALGIFCYASYSEGKEVKR